MMVIGVIFCVRCHEHHISRVFHRWLEVTAKLLVSLVDGNGDGDGS